jgi:hypothetical protein
MNSGKPTFSDGDIDALVATHLQQEAAKIDTSASLARLRDALADEAATPAPLPFRRRSIVRVIRWSLSVAALIAITALVLTETQKSAYATPTQLLRDAEVSLDQPLDRCYLVESSVEPTSMSEDDASVLKQSWTTKLWVRGDRYWLESANPDRHWAWGRDDKGGIWMAIAPHKGLRFDADEVPGPLGMVAEMLGVRMKTMLTQMLKNAELRRDEIVAHGEHQGPVVLATLRPGDPNAPLRSAKFEFDASTRQLRRLTLDRVFGDRRNVTTLTLLETRRLSEDQYRLDGHLEKPFEVYSRENQPERRRAIMIHTFGPRAGAWRPQPPMGFRR